MKQGSIIIPEHSSIINSTSLTLSPDLIVKQGSKHTNQAHFQHQIPQQSMQQNQQYSQVKLSQASHQQPTTDNIHQQKQQTDTLITQTTPTQGGNVTAGSNKSSKNSTTLMSIKQHGVAGQSTEPTMYTTKDVGDNPTITQQQQPAVTTSNSVTTGKQIAGKSQSQLQQYHPSHQPVVVGSSVQGLGNATSSQTNVHKQAQSTSKKDSQQQNSPRDLDKIQSLIHYKQNLNSHNHTPNQQQNQFKSSSQPSGKNQNNIFQQHAASMKNLIDPIQLHTVTEEIHQGGANAQNPQLVLQVSDQTKFGAGSKNANTSSSGQVINKRNSNNIQQHTASSQHIFNSGQNQSSDSTQLQIQSQNSQQQQNMIKQNAYQMLNQRQLERQMMIQQSNKNANKDSNKSKLDSSNIINSTNITQYDPKSIQSTTINSTSKQNSDPTQNQSGLVKNRNWEIKQRSNLISAEASRHLYQTFQKLGGQEQNPQSTSGNQQPSGVNQNNTSFNQNRNSINNQNLSSYNNNNQSQQVQNNSNNIVERSANNRESLQSRLLERITTKKNRSPQEIYLEEELSSEDEDDEYNQQRKIIDTENNQQKQPKNTANILNSDPKSQYYNGVTTTTGNKKADLEKKGIASQLNSEQKRDEISTERRKTPTEDDMYGDIEDMIETERNNTKTAAEKLKMQMMRKSKYGQMQGSTGNGKKLQSKKTEQSCHSSSEGSNENTNITNTDQNGSNSYEQRKASRKNNKSRRQSSNGGGNIQQSSQVQAKNDATLRQSHQKNPKENQQSLQGKDLKKRKKSSDRHHQQASNTHYGTKFYEFRNTLQNFNNKSNNALNNIMHNQDKLNKPQNDSSTNKIVINGSKQVSGGNVLLKGGGEQLTSLQESNQEQSNDYNDNDTSLQHLQESGKQINQKSGSKESSFVEGGQQILPQAKNMKQLKSANEQNVYTASWNNNNNNTSGTQNEINQNHQLQSYGHHHYNQQQFNMGGSSGNWRKVAMTQNNFYDPRNEGSRGPAIRNNQSHSNDTKRFTHNQNPNMVQQYMYPQNQNSQQYQQKSPFQNYGAVNSSNNNQNAKGQYGPGYFSKAHAQVGNSSSQAYGYSQNNNAAMVNQEGSNGGYGNHKNQILHQQHQQPSFNQKQNSYFQQSPNNSKQGGANLNTSNFGRKTFYVSDQQQKHKLEYVQGSIPANNQNLGNIPIKNARGPGANLPTNPHNQMVDYYNQHGGTSNQYAAGHYQQQQVPSSQNPNMLLDQNTHFNKPRALSRQADAHIKIEVHRDTTIRNHLIAEKEEGMNLMFYDFNLSSVGGNTRQGGDRVKNSGQAQPNAGTAAQQMTCTAQNFYRQGKGERMYYNKQGGVDGDRVPTRERGYRSAQQNFRKHHQQQQQQQYQHYQQQQQQQQYFNNQQQNQQTGGQPTQGNSQKQYINQPGKAQQMVKNKQGSQTQASSKIVVNNSSQNGNSTEDVV